MWPENSGLRAAGFLGIVEGCLTLRRSGLVDPKLTGFM